MKTVYKENITILVPTYNSEKTIIRALNSILNQSIPVLEILVLDNGSSDNTTVLVDKLKENNPPIKLILCKIKKNKPAALNEGLKLARSSFIGFLDSDDFLHTDFLRILMTGFHLFPSAIISQVSYAKNVLPKKVYNLYYTLIDNKNIVMKYYSIGKIDVVLWNKLYKSEVFDDFRFDEKKIVDDASSTYKLIYQNPIIVLNQSILYNYTYHQFSLSNKPKNLEYIYQNIQIAIETHDYFYSTKELSLILPKIVNRLFLDIIMLGESESNKLKLNETLRNIYSHSSFKKSKLFIFRFLNHLSPFLSTLLFKILKIMFIDFYLVIIKKRNYK